MAPRSGPTLTVGDVVPFAHADLDLLVAPSSILSCSLDLIDAAALSKLFYYAYVYNCCPRLAPTVRSNAQICAVFPLRDALFPVYADAVRSSTKQKSL